MRSSGMQGRGRRLPVLLLILAHCEPGADRKIAAAATGAGDLQPCRAMRVPASFTSLYLVDVLQNFQLREHGSAASSQMEACGRLVQHRPGMIRLKGGGEPLNATAFELGGGPRASCKRPASALSVALVSTLCLPSDEKCCAVYNLPCPFWCGMCFDECVSGMYSNACAVRRRTPWQRRWWQRTMKRVRWKRCSAAIEQTRPSSGAAF